MLITLSSADDLAIKKNFKPDIVYVDYLNICASSRYKNNIVNSYTYIKSIAEELRGMPVSTGSSFLLLKPLVQVMVALTLTLLTLESLVSPATAELMLALISTEELEELGQIMVKQLKNWIPIQLSTVSLFWVLTETR